MQIGKYSTDEFVKYLRQNPELMDKMLRLYNDFDLAGLKELFNKLDFGASFVGGPLTNKGYIENKAEIDRLIKDPDSYLEKIENRDYLEDERIQKYYAGSVEIYDEIWGGAWVYETRKEAVDWVEAKPEEKIIEVGVGTGVNLEYLPENCEITGIDFTEPMLEKAREKQKRLVNKKITLEFMDARELAFPDNSFDKVFSFYFLSSTRDPLRVLQEMSRVCKPGGRVVIFDVVWSDIEEVAVVQYLYRPIAKEIGPIYLEFSPPYMVPYDACLKLFDLLEKTNIKVEEVKFSDPFRTIVLFRATNKK